MTAARDFVCVSRPWAGQTKAVRQLIDTCVEVDGTPSFSDHVLVDLNASLENAGPNNHLMVWEGDRLVAYAHLSSLDRSAQNVTGEFAVAPSRRGHGVGRSLLTRILQSTITQGRDRLLIWDHLNSPAARRLARRFDMINSRQLLRMTTTATASSSLWDMPKLPPGYRLRSFVVGVDEGALLELNRRSFSWHPEQGTWKESDLRARMGEEWFDPGGIIVLEGRHDDGSYSMEGFIWTKIHRFHPQEACAVGEGYVMAVNPALRGDGLGRALFTAHLRYLADRGLNKMMIYVEADNPKPRHFGETHGFEVADIHIQWETSTGREDVKS